MLIINSNCIFATLSLPSSFLISSFVEILTMLFSIHLKELLLDVEHSLFVISSVLAAITFIIVVFSTKRTNVAEAIPLYAPETSDMGNYKRRWKFDSSNLLKEAYQKVSG
jgi:hypothetical protein